MTEPVTQSPPDAAETLDEAKMAELLRKHNAEIERVRALNTASPDGVKDQQGEFEKYGIDPEALKAHYKDLQIRNNELLDRARVANRRTSIMGWTALLGTAAATIWKREKIAPGNKLMQGTFIGLLSSIAGLASANIGSFLFNRNIRIESKALVEEAGAIFERELAVAIENKERESGQRPVADVTPKAGMGVTGLKQPEAEATLTPRTKQPPEPRGSFMAEAMKEKAAAQEQAVNR